MSDYWQEWTKLVGANLSPEQLSARRKLLEDFLRNMSEDDWASDLSLMGGPFSRVKAEHVKDFLRQAQEYGQDPYQLWLLGGERPARFGRLDWGDVDPNQPESRSGEPNPHDANLPASP